MSLPFLEKVKNCATALVDHRAAILFTLNFVEGVMQYTEVQNIAKKTIEFIKDNIQPGMTLLEVRHLCETKMMELGADSFWYWNVGAFVFAGDETTLSVSGKEYTTSERVIAENDIITIDLSPQNEDT